MFRSTLRGAKFRLEIKVRNFKCELFVQNRIYCNLLATSNNNVDFQMVLL